MKTTDCHVIISVEPFKRSFKTIVEGVTADRDLLKTWKKKLSCGGVLVDKIMTFQGDHHKTLYEWIVGMGYSPDHIVIAGIGK